MLQAYQKIPPKAARNKKRASAITLLQPGILSKKPLIIQHDSTPLYYRDVNHLYNENGVKSTHKQHVVSTTLIGIAFLSYGNLERILVVDNDFSSKLNFQMFICSVGILLKMNRNGKMIRRRKTAPTTKYSPQKNRKTRQVLKNFQNLPVQLSHKNDGNCLKIRLPLPPQGNKKLRIARKSASSGF